MLAIRTKHIEIVKNLMFLKCDPLIKANSGITALDICDNNMKKFISEYINVFF